MARIHLVTEIGAPPERCFDAARDVTVHLASWPAHSAVAGVRAGPMHLGDEVTWRAPHFGIAWRMTSKIVVYERPRRFVDEMQRGPFARWRHEHRFLPIPQGTRMIDDVAFASPLGPLGWLVDQVVLQRFMLRLLLEHNAAVARASSTPYASGSTSTSSIDLPPTLSSHRCTRREN